MANVYDKLKEMNITLPAPPPKGGVYTPVMEFGDHLLYCSGCGPDIGDGHNIVGKVGGDLTLMAVITLAVILLIAAVLLRSPMAGRPAIGAEETT